MVMRDHNGKVDWRSPDNAELLGRMRELWDSGMSTQKIADALGVSKNAVIGVSNRFGFPGRASPIRRGDGPKPPRPEATPKVTLPPLASEMSSHDDDRLAITIMVRHATQAATLRPARGVCCWPIGPRGAVRYCDAPAERGSYCGGHAAIAYQPGKVAA